MLGEKQPRSRERNISDFIFLVLILPFLLDANNTVYFNFKIAVKKYKRLFYNNTSFLLMIAIADNALFKYNTLDDLY